MKANILWLIVLLGLLSLALIHGCDQERSSQSPAAPEGTVAQKVVLRVGGVPSKANAKVTNLRIEAVGINENGARVGAAIPPVVIANPTFPQAVELTLYRPPCRYRITVTTDLSRDAARTWEDQIDICQQKAGALTIDVFESFFADQLTIQAPQMVNAGEALTASCEAEGVNAPDSAQYPLTVTLSERGGSRFDSAPNGLSVSGAFPDPYTAAETERVLNCSIADGRSTPQSVTKTIARVLPTPIPGVTVTPVPDVTVTPPPVGSSALTVTKSGTGTGTVTSGPAGINCGGTCSASFGNGAIVYLFATPNARMGFVGWSGAYTGTANPCAVTMNTTQTANAEFVDLCLVTDAGDTGLPGQLRQVLTDAMTNGCSTITFASAVTTITVASQLTPPAMMLTIDGGSGVTISGGNTTGVFQILAGANVTFTGLTITQGNSTIGAGGIDIDLGGTVTIESNTTVSGNKGTDGGGIYNIGTLTVRGTVGGTTPGSGNTATMSGGGISNSNTLTIETIGKVIGNTATWGGGGILSSGTLTMHGTVSGNTATLNGGGIHTSGTADVSGLITDNTTTTGTGGGIYIAGGTVTGTALTYSGNTPNDCATAGPACP